MYTDKFINSINNNKHTFNIAKYHKQSFRLIPVLKNYDVIVWLDGTIEIIYDDTNKIYKNKIYTNKIIGWHHDHHDSILHLLTFQLLIFTTSKKSKIMCSIKYIIIYYYIL